MRLDSAMISHPGARAENEDACGYEQVSAVCGCWVVADGLGGHGGGATASRVAVDAIRSGFRGERRVSAAAAESLVACAHAAVRDGQGKSGELRHMRTTVALLLTDGANTTVCHVGDSRLYEFRRGVLVAWTRDHSVPQLLADAGDIRADEIRSHPDRNRVLRALGTDEPPSPTVQVGDRPIQVGDAFLLCSDGFWEHVLEGEMAEKLRASASAEQWLAALEPLVRERLGPSSDNYTALAVMAVADDSAIRVDRSESSHPSR